MKQNAFAAYEEMRASVAASVPRRVQDFGHGRDRDAVVCPEPRRVGAFNLPPVAEPIRSLRWHVSHQQEVCDAKAGAELLDIILAKGGYGADQSSCAQAASSPPFFCGSPPSRVSNPLIQDARFGDEKATPVSPRAIPIPSGLAPSPTASARKAGGCVRANFGNNPAVRVEGFDCLDRDRRNCSIPALA
ncbi:OLC1v1032287C1 [Oldenlandia corymbosa var. corymbosa]|uniref:OLC1v1032287C1 n=1 Tax=Oldenlandia corymbosa var. corymbosa TaxID=529605 RepID=A0AAV1CLF6_OLDCO|nr:OLC1v1032287C1 [Oldenlandia corymbosa var. corymbosa]